MSIKSRFIDTTDLVEALSHQQLVNGDQDLAKTLAEAGELIEFAPGKTIIEQGGYDRDVYFLLAGKATLIVNGYRLYPRERGVAVGEMSAINSQIPRAATVEATEPTVAWKISHRRLEEVGELFPALWRRLATEMTKRLEQRNSFVNRANARPRVFIICSAESLPIARAIRIGLDHVKADVVMWSDEEIFETGSYPLEALEQEVNQADFGIALAEPDDLVRSRDRSERTPRDNVIFEVGFFMSRLGRDRTLMLVPRGEEVRLPTDFKGLTPITYKAEGEGKQLATSMATCVDRIINIINERGVRNSLVEAK